MKEKCKACEGNNPVGHTCLCKHGWPLPQGKTECDCHGVKQEPMENKTCYETPCPKCNDANCICPSLLAKKAMENKNWEKEFDDIVDFTHMDKSGLVEDRQLVIARPSVHVKKFIEKLRQEALPTFLKGEILRLKGKKFRVISPYENERDYQNKKKGYEQSLDDQITHYKTMIKELEK